MDRYFTAMTALIIVGLGLSRVFRKSFDPFEPIWLFLAGYTQIYVVQATSYRDWGIQARSEAIVEMAAIRAFWALLVFLAFYYCGLGKRIARLLPKVPDFWPTPVVVGVSPLLILWGLVCSLLTFRVATLGAQAQDSLLVQFPLFLLVGGVLLLVTGRNRERPSTPLAIAGGLVCAAYAAIWMFNAKRSHAVFGVLAGTCAYYLPKWKRPSLPAVGGLGMVCALAVTIAIGWRGTNRYEQSLSGFFQYLSEFRLESVLENLNMKDREGVNPESREQTSKETEEWGGYLLMLDTVPDKSPYDYGQSYLRLYSTFIPRAVWPDKPFYGRSEWIAAWQAGSEFHREDTFTGPAIGILGAAQLNGGAIGTALVMAGIALLLRTAYDYYRYHSHLPWAQAWWALTYFNSWLMTVNDDPFVWFYYVYGFTVLPTLGGLWIALKLTAPRTASLA